MDVTLRAKARAAVVRLAHAGYRLPDLFQRAGELLYPAVPFDAGCWHTLDPATLLETSHDVVNLPFENPRASELEYLYQDFNQFATLARAPRRSGILSEATEGVPERSRRYRELIRPFGLRGELRATFVTGGEAWGALGLLRASTMDFTAAESAFVDEISGYLAHAVRVALLQESAALEPPPAGGPGVVLLDHSLRLEAATAAARRLLAEIADQPTEDALPYVVYAVAARARVAGRSAGEEGLARSRVPARSGGWLTLHGSLTHEDSARIAVIVERAQPAAIAPLIARAHGLTAREAQLLPYLLRGESTKQIAGSLAISPYTVQEHCTRIFDKLGVRTRRALAARLFFGR